MGAFVIQRILGQDTPWGGIATATVTIGTAFMSQYLSRLMSKRGRRDGLRLGYFLAIIGGFIAAIGYVPGVRLNEVPPVIANPFTSSGRPGGEV